MKIIRKSETVVHEYIINHDHMDYKYREWIDNGKVINSEVTCMDGEFCSDEDELLQEFSEFVESKQ